MAMIDEFLDPDTARMLRDAFGGRRISVPKHRTGAAWHRLAEGLGEERAARVVRWFGGEALLVPMAHHERINEAVIALRNEGVPVSEIAKLTFPCRLSERHIHRICAAEKAERNEKNV